MTITTNEMFRNTFKTEDGQQVLRDLSLNFYVSSTTMGKDSLETAYNEGQRSVILHILRRLATTDEEYPTYESGHSYIYDYLTTEGI